MGPRRDRLKRFLGGAVAVVYATANVAFVHATEDSFWLERRRVFQKRASLQLASLPSIPVHLPKAVPYSSTVPSVVVRSLPPEFHAANAALLDNIPFASGTVRAVSLPAGPIRKTVVHIHDVHMNLEAQRRIAETVNALSRRGAAGLVALEGAWEDIDLGRFRAFPDRAAVRRAADYLLRENRISGPVHAAFTGPLEMPRFCGVDDPAFYRSNVEAYRRAASRAAEDKACHAEFRAALARRKEALFSPTLKSLDAAVQSHRDGRGRLGDYLQALSKNVPDSTLGPSVRLYLQALARESALDFNAVEADRGRLVEILLRTLSPEGVKGLTEDSLGYRLGRLGLAEFYSRLDALCRKAGVPLSRFPAMDAYVRYVLVSDRISLEKLNREMADLERSAFARVAQKPVERALVAEDRQLYLSGKLIDFALTSGEWGEYRGMRERGRKEARGHVGANGTKAEFVERIEWAPYEEFYRQADARDQAMAANVVAAMDKAGTATAILVAGGYHAAGMARRLAEAGVATIAFTPRIETLETVSGPVSLSVFTREKTPLDKLFQGEKLFLAPRPVQGDGGGAILAASAAAAKSNESAQDLEDMVLDALRRLEGPFAIPGTRVKVVRRVNPQDQVEVESWLTRGTSSFGIAVSCEPNGAITGVRLLSPGAVGAGFRLARDLAAGFGRLLAKISYSPRRAPGMEWPLFFGLPLLGGNAGFQALLDLHAKKISGLNRVLLWHAGLFFFHERLRSHFLQERRLLQWVRESFLAHRHWNARVPEALFHLGGGPRFAEGVFVDHPRYGRGRVEGVDPDGAVRVSFGEGAASFVSVFPPALQASLEPGGSETRGREAERQRQITGARDRILRLWPYAMGQSFVRIAVGYMAASVPNANSLNETANLFQRVMAQLRAERLPEKRDLEALEERFREAEDRWSSQLQDVRRLGPLERRMIRWVVGQKQPRIQREDAPVSEQVFERFATKARDAITGRMKTDLKKEFLLWHLKQYEGRASDPFFNPLEEGWAERTGWGWVRPFAAMDLILSRNHADSSANTRANVLRINETIVQDATISFRHGRDPSLNAADGRRDVVLGFRRHWARGDFPYERWLIKNDAALLGRAKSYFKTVGNAMRAAGIPAFNGRGRLTGSEDQNEKMARFINNISVGEIENMQALNSAPEGSFALLWAITTYGSWPAAVKKIRGLAIRSPALPLVNDAHVETVAQAAGIIIPPVALFESRKAHESIRSLESLINNMETHLNTHGEDPLPSDGKASSLVHAWGTFGLAVGSRWGFGTKEWAGRIKIIGLAGLGVEIPGLLASALLWAPGWGQTLAGWAGWTFGFSIFADPAAAGIGMAVFLAFFLLAHLLPEAAARAINRVRGPPKRALLNRIGVLLPYLGSAIAWPLILGVGANEGVLSLAGWTGVVLMGAFLFWSVRHHWRYDVKVLGGAEGIRAVHIAPILLTLFLPLAAPVPAEAELSAPSPPTQAAPLREITTRQWMDWTREFFADLVPRWRLSDNMELRAYAPLAEKAAGRLVILRDNPAALAMVKPELGRDGRYQYDPDGRPLFSLYLNDRAWASALMRFRESDGIKKEATRIAMEAMVVKEMATVTAQAADPDRALRREAVARALTAELKLFADEKGGLDITRIPEGALKSGSPLAEKIKILAAGALEEEAAGYEAMRRFLIGNKLTSDRLGALKEAGTLGRYAWRHLTELSQLSRGGRRAVALYHLVSQVRKAMELPVADATSTLYDLAGKIAMADGELLSGYRLPVDKNNLPLPTVMPWITDPDYVGVSEEALRRAGLKNDPPRDPTGTPGVGPTSKREAPPRGRRASPTADKLAEAVFSGQIPRLSETDIEGLKRLFPTPFALGLSALNSAGVGFAADVNHALRKRGMDPAAVSRGKLVGSILGFGGEAVNLKSELALLLVVAPGNASGALALARSLAALNEGAEDPVTLFLAPADTATARLLMEAQSDHVRVIAASAAAGAVRLGPVEDAFESWRAGRGEVTLLAAQMGNVRLEGKESLDPRGLVARAIANLHVAVIFEKALRLGFLIARMA